MVKFRLEPGQQPALTREEQAAWEHVVSMPDSEIDYSDIPPLPETGWRRVSDLVPEENKQQITLRLDADVIAFFKSTGRRYQSRINAALREYMRAHKAS